MNTPGTASGQDFVDTLEGDDLLLYLYQNIRHVSWGGDRTYLCTQFNRFSDLTANGTSLTFKLTGHLQYTAGYFDTKGGRFKIFPVL